MSRFSKKFEHNFWRRFQRMSTGCREWTGARHKAGYGEVSCRAVSSQPLLTHRVAWELKKGPIPEGLHVLHKCDNPPCGWIKHLFLGTPLANAEDRDDKGRGNSGDKNGARTQRDRNPFVINGGAGLKGENHPMAKLTNMQVDEIITRYAQGEKPTTLATEFAVSRTHIHRLIKKGGNAHARPQQN